MKEYRRLHLDLIKLLIRRVIEDNARSRAEGLLEDMGYDDCPVCIANRQRQAWT